MTGKADPLFSVAGQVVLVSGGSRGIGKSLAAGFAEREATVIITGREAETIEATAKELSSLGTVVPMICDVSKTEDIEKTTAEICNKFGRIDTLLNVAGVNKRKKIETFTPEEYDFILDINLRGCFFVALEVGKQMIKTGTAGTIINIDSLNTSSPLRGVLPYAMSKAGVSMMTRGLATEWGRHKVRVNALAPGFILTDMTNKLWSDPTMQKWAYDNTPLQRLGIVDDLIGTSVFLASKASAFMTGQVLYVDGGFSAGTLWPIPLD